MFANSFSVLFIHCIAQGLGASFRTSALHHTVVPCNSMAFLLALLVN